MKTYRDDAWRDFYIFDVMEGDKYIPYDEYKPLLESFNLNYIPPLAIVNNPTYESLIKLLDKNKYLIKDGNGSGEGIVIKNYEFVNKYGRTTWAKIVTNEFKEKHHKEMGAPKVESKTVIEEKILDKYVTKSLIEKEYSKIVNEKDGWRSEYIPMLFGRVYHALVTEETWNFVKDFKRPKVDFKRLYNLTISKVKEVKSDLF